MDRAAVRRGDGAGTVVSETELREAAAALRKFYGIDVLHEIGLGALADGTPANEEMALWRDLDAALASIPAEPEQADEVAGLDVEAVLEANHRGNVAALLDYRRGVSDGQVQALQLDVKAIKDEVRNLAYLTREEWAERRGGDPIARTINAVFDILDARLAPARDDTSGGAS